MIYLEILCGLQAGTIGYLSWKLWHTNLQLKLHQAIRLLEAGAHVKCERCKLAVARARMVMGRLLCANCEVETKNGTLP